MAGAHLTEAQIQGVGLARLPAVQIPHRPVFRCQPSHSLNLAFGTVGGGIVHRQNADAPGILLTEQRLNGSGDVPFLIVGAQDDGGVLAGLRILPPPSVQQIGKEHGAHQIARQKGDADDHRPHIDRRQHLYRFLDPGERQPDRKRQPQHAEPHGQDEFSVHPNPSFFDSLCERRAKGAGV